MIEVLLALVPVGGPWIVGTATFLSCLALPVPSSLIMLTAGAFVASGDLSGPVTVALALAGALTGDQLGYALGRAGFSGKTVPTIKMTQFLTKAQILLARHGVWAVFLSRWLLSPLGPYVNLICGATRSSWWRFSLAGLAGESLWVGLYLGAGYTFAGHVEAIADIAGNLSGALSAGAVTLGLVLVLRSALRATGSHR
ncbi:DedA family protein [Paracoccus lutimaris]|jgi:membrane-associated protein|uniref:Membrane protein DedA with SNARE-associated domain n=1 Tax=Paracoccus lutimaris TaxID=1490030 RepID=A0A368YEJ2_9RHOB|nr:VTT domain-containing protein [Paracoccus lutimaris]RCW77868.1 membrane protein DedA with SNARE-associated domain [Paracoccus lutimaris]